MLVRFNQTCNDFDKGEEVECTYDEIRHFRPECYTVIRGDPQETDDMKDAPPQENDGRNTADAKDAPPPAEKTTTATRARRTTAVK